MILFVLLWQGYVAAADSYGELRKLLPLNSSIASMSVNGQEGVEVPLVDLGLSSEPAQKSKDPWADLPKDSLIQSMIALETQKKVLNQPSSKKDCQKLGAALAVPILCGAGCSITGGVLFGPYGALAGFIINLGVASPASIRPVGWCYDTWDHQRIENEEQRLGDEIKRIKEILKMRED